MNSIASITFYNLAHRKPDPTGCVTLHGDRRVFEEGLESANFGWRPIHGVISHRDISRAPGSRQ